VDPLELVEFYLERWRSQVNLNWKAIYGESIQKNLESDLRYPTCGISCSPDSSNLFRSEEKCVDFLMMLKFSKSDI